MRFSPEQGNPPIPSSPTRKQLAFMERHRISCDRPLDYFEATHAIGRFIHARRRLPPTERQVQLLRKLGTWRDGMTRGEASDAIRRSMGNRS